MKAFIFTVLAFSLLSFQTQQEEVYPYFEALGKVLSKKEFKKLAGMKCFVVSRMQVTSKENDIVFKLNIETQKLQSIEFRSAFLERQPYTSDPVLGITTTMGFRECYDFLKEKDGITKLSDDEEESSFVSFYYQEGQDAKLLYFNVFFKKDGIEVETVSRITFTNASEK